MTDEDPEERAERLKGRFSTSTDDESETDNTTDTSEASKTHDAPTTPDPSSAPNTPVRERETKMLYLEEEFKEELDLAFDELNLRWKREFGEELQQNVHWYPVLLRLGYEAVGDVSELDLEEFEDLLE